LSGFRALQVLRCGSYLAARERPSFGFWLSALAGAALVIGFSLRDGEGGFGIGDVLLLGAVLSAASGYTVLAGLTKSRPGWEVISWTVVISLPVTLPFAVLTAPSDLFAVPLPHWGAFLYLGLMSQYVGFFFWNTGLAMGGQARVSQTQLLQTFVTLAFAAWVNGEQVDLLTWIFAVAVVGVVLIGRRTRIVKGS
jgi:drug/metabolite transporter (DMT)-like permease